jgi:acetyl-CoA carboxylase carboxyl transferase subunit alpha
MKITAKDLLELGVVDDILPEPVGGAHTDWAATAKAVGDGIRRHLSELSRIPPEELVARRTLKYRSIGRWSEPGR